MAEIECCEFDSPIMIGDTAAVIEINSGGPDPVDDIVIYAEGCECGFDDLYSDLYCDVSESGAFPNALITDTEYHITSIPANHTLTIDAVERVVKLHETGDSEHQVGGIEALEFPGLFEWIYSMHGGCQRICVDASEAATNPDTTIRILHYDREL